MIKKARRYKWIILLSSYFLLFGFLAVFDEPLSTEAMSVLNDSSRSIPDEENGYYSIMGFTASTGSDIHAKGVEIIRSFETALKKDPSIEKFDQQALLGPELSVSGQLPDIYKDSHFSCLSYVTKAKKDIESMFANNRELLDRYYSLYRYPHIAVTGRPLMSAPFPHYGPVRKMHALVLFRLSNDTKSGRVSSALDGLKQDIEYWRLVLKESDDLITKLVAALTIKEDYLFLSELLSQRKIGPKDMATADLLMKPLTPQEANMSGPMRREFQFQKNAIQDIKGSFLKQEPNGKNPAWKFLLWPFFKVNASINIIYPSYKKLIDAAALPAPEFVRESNKWEEPERMKLGIEMFYNWAGALFHEPVGDRENLKYVTYVTKIHDLDGLLRLVCIQFSAYQDRIPVEKMQNYLLNVGIRYSNPYTGESMQWDAEKKCLYFESVTKENQKPKRIELYL